MASRPPYQITPAGQQQACLQLSTILRPQGGVKVKLLEWIQVSLDDQ
ncbi:MAG TPA: hypothetical protein VK206_26280 [Anaerolineales bacterium]|nr:hypothetical protein [Anaerolineales bacterium]